MLVIARIFAISRGELHIQQKQIEYLPKGLYIKCDYLKYMNKELDWFCLMKSVVLIAKRQMRMWQCKKCI